jgi:hypothetical protein
MRILFQSVGVQTSPDLASGTAVIVEEANEQASFRSNCGSRNATRSGAHHCDIECSSHSVATSIAGAHISWQVR